MDGVLLQRAFSDGSRPGAPGLPIIWGKKAENKSRHGKYNKSKRFESFDSYSVYLMSPPTIPNFDFRQVNKCSYASVSGSDCNSKTCLKKSY